MAGSLNSKRVFLMMLAAFGLVAALVCGGLLLAGVREPSRELLFLVGSLVVVSIVCLVLSFVFKDTAMQLEEDMKQADYQRVQKASVDQDQTPLPQNKPAGAHPDDVQLPQNRPADPDDVQLPQNADGGGMR